MTVLFSLLLIAVGIVALIWGSNFLIDNAAVLAKRFGVSTLLIGLTVVAFGTSAPELATSVVAALQGFPELAMGNVIGSNIANLALVLGVAGIIHPLTAHGGFVKRDVPFMLLTSLLLVPLTLDVNGDGLGEVSRLEGGVLVVLLIAYMMLLVRSDTPADVDEVTEALQEHKDDPLWKVAGLAVLGMVLLVVGAQLLVQGASSLARTFGISDRVIGVTVVALGTSLPELAATIVAALKREVDIIVGNLVGSNIFNILSIIGVTAVVRPLVLPPEVANVDFWVMLVVSVITGGLLAWRTRFGKLEGISLVSIYGLYIAYIAVTQFS